MKTINVNNNQLTTAQKRLLKTIALKNGFSSSITNGGSFTSYNGGMQHYTATDWVAIDHLTEIEVTEKEKKGELKGGRKYYQSFGVCYFVDSKVLKQLDIH